MDAIGLRLTTTRVSGQERRSEEKVRRSTRAAASPSQESAGAAADLALVRGGGAMDRRGEDCRKRRFDAYGSGGRLEGGGRGAGE
jgi:hypothetical protein